MHRQKMFLNIFCWQRQWVSGMRRGLRSMSFVKTVIIVLAGLFALAPISFAIEWLRPVPKAPQTLGWAPRLALHELDLGGTHVRYIRTGTGPNLILLHTLRTQLDIFQHIIP